MPIRQLKSGKYQARVWDNDNKKYVSLGTFATEKEATLAELRAEAGLDQEEKTKAPPKAIPRGREKFSKFALEVFDSKKHTWATSTYLAHVRNLDKHLKPFLNTLFGTAGGGTL